MEENGKKRGPSPELNWKWPLTHSERIMELQELLTMDYYKRNHENIQAAIEYHRGFPAGEFCSDNRVYFMDGRKLDEEEDPLPPMWAEVKLSQLSKYRVRLCLLG
jgi:hypothetical protein